MPFWSASGARSASTSSIRGASSISSLQGMARSSLISSNVLVMLDILSVWSRSSVRRSLVAGGTSGCSTANSSIWACMSASGVRNSCAALPENWRCAAKPASRRCIMPLNDSLNLLNSGSTSSLIFESARFPGCTCSICAAKARRGLSARPLAKYASTPPISVTKAVMHQLVAPNDFCASLTTIVSSLPTSSLPGSNDLGTSSFTLL